MTKRERKPEWATCKALWPKPHAVPERSSAERSAPKIVRPRCRHRSEHSIRPIHRSLRTRLAPNKGTSRTQLLGVKALLHVGTRACRPVGTSKFYRAD